MSIRPTQGTLGTALTAQWAVATGRNRHPWVAAPRNDPDLARAWHARPPAAVWHDKTAPMRRAGVKRGRSLAFPGCIPVMGTCVGALERPGTNGGLSSRRSDHLV
jgi:hypothetical protein